jgi:putative SOS response-associated peptidase YedK
VQPLLHDAQPRSDPAAVPGLSQSRRRLRAAVRDLPRHRRCLVPASSYCEPKGEKPATWHWFSINGDEGRPVFAFPGVWTRYKGPLKKNGDSVEQEVFAFMTTEPNELTASINHERMPVLLTDPADFETWLSGSTEEAFKLARSYAADQMRIVQSGSERKDLLAA